METNGSALTVTGDVASMLPEKVIEMVSGSGDLGKLSTQERARYIVALCRSLNLNPLSRPIEFMTLNGRTIPYAKKDCTDQLRKRDKISIEVIGKESVDGVITVTARATTPDGRTDEDIGAVVIANLKGADLANAHMKALTKAKRRVTLSICGLGFLDESELDTIAADPRYHQGAPRHVEASADFVEETAEEKTRRWADAICACTTISQLTALSREIKKESLPAEARVAVLAIYKQRKAELDAPPPGEGSAE